MTDLTFSQDELTALSTSPGDHIAAALDAGDTDRAREIATGSVDLHFSTRDIYTLWNALTLSYIEREFGAEAQAAAVEDALRRVVRPWAEWFRNGVSREAVQTLAMIFRMDGAELAAVEEDADTIVLVSPAWVANRADEIPGAADLRMVTTEIERLCCEWLGYPPFVFAGGAGGEPLRLTIHKDPLAVPVDVFERLGVTRDAARIGAAFNVEGALLFGDDEREALRFQAYVLCARAIEAGDLDLARRHAMLSKTEWYPGHNFGRDLVTGLNSWILDTHGVAQVWDAVDACYDRPTMGAVLDQVEQMPYRDQVEWLATLFHQHGMKFTLHEDEGRFRFHTTPCGSGGRLIEEGAYAAPKNLSEVQGPSVESFGVDQLPVYCMHCPCTNKHVLERGGPYFLLVEPDIADGRVTGHCSFNIFKSREAVPQDVFDRVGVPAG